MTSSQLGTIDDLSVGILAGKRGGINVFYLNGRVQALQNPLRMIRSVRGINGFHRREDNRITAPFNLGKTLTLLQ